MGVKTRYRYRLRVNASHVALLQQVFDADRRVWNLALGRWSELWRDEHLGFSYGDAAAELTDWRGRWEWLAAQPCIPQQQVLRDLFKSISAFFDKKNPAGRPQFKERKKGYATARWTKNGFAIKDGRLEVATSAGRLPLRVVWSRELPSPPGMVTVRRDRAGHWWATFTTEIETQDVGSTGVTTGLDVGLTTFATTEFADADVPNPRFARRAAKALARSQRNLSRKKKGSRNRVKAKTANAKAHSHVANQRSDWQHKQARTLAARFDRIGIEDLKIKNMTRRGKGRRKGGLNRSIADAGWGDFARLLEWHAGKVGHEVIRFPARNTTQTCSCCGAIAKPRIELSDRVYNCSTCGMVEDRDRNAARNLNPNRRDKPGAGCDGSKTLVLASTKAA